MYPITRGLAGHYTHDGFILSFAPHLPRVWVAHEAIHRQKRRIVEPENCTGAFAVKQMLRCAFIENIIVYYKLLSSSPLISSEMLM